MRLLRHRKLLRLVLVALLVASAVFGWVAMRDGEETYVAGERTDGLIDTLARDVPADHPEVRFTDVASEAGLVFRHFPGVRTNRLPEDMGSGVALGDVDGDGWTDVFLVNAAGPMPAMDGGWDRELGRSRLYRNQGDGHFEDVTYRSGIDQLELGMAAAFLDADSDGDLDLFTTSYPRCRFFRNDGAGRFQDESEAAGVDRFEGFWTGIATGDYDLDGAIDVYVCGYVRFRDEPEQASQLDAQFGVDIPRSINPSSFEPERNLLFHNLGDAVFEELAESTGVANPGGRSLGATFADLTGDGLPDLYVANDVSDNAFFVNRGDGRFDDRAPETLVADYRGAMGLSAGDFDRDGDLDLFITHWVGQENALYVSHPRPGVVEGPLALVPIFMDMADRHGLGQVALDVVGWATRFFDYDMDGRLDLLAVNGSTIPLREDQTRLTPMRTHLYWNAGKERGFFEVGAVSGDFFRAEHVGRGGATFDYDQDGDEDLLIVCHGEGAALLHNDGGNANASLRLRLRQREGNRFALGARIHATIGGEGFFDELETQGSYLSQHAVGELAIGMGRASWVDEIRVRWPDGIEESGGPFPAGAIVAWTRGLKPRVEPLPGKLALLCEGPKDLEAKRSFFALRDEAASARLAGERDRAIALYQEALSLWPAHADCLYYLGNTWMELGQESRALSAFEWEVAVHPESSSAWMQIGVLRLPGGDPALDDLALAEAAFRRNHELNKEESGPVVKLALVALLDGDPERAEAFIADAMLLNPRSVEGLYIAGRLAWLRGEHERAGELLERAHAIAGEKGPAPQLASSEGDTRSGQALVAATLRSPLFWERWRTLAQRAVDPAIEYGD